MKTVAFGAINPEKTELASAGIHLALSDGAHTEPQGEYWEWEGFEDLRQLQRCQARFVQIHDGDVLIASATWEENNPNNPERYASINNVVTAEDIRGTGVGRLLMSAVHTDILNFGITKATLDSLAPVVGFYEKLGYASIGSVAAAQRMEIQLPLKVRS